MKVVWFKRDLRIEDHPALFEAAKTNRILPLYILEPDLWQQPDLSHRQYQFLVQAIEDLNKSLKFIGQELIIKVGDAVSVLEKIHKDHTITALFSHQETWNNWSYMRDRRVQKWTRYK